LPLLRLRNKDDPPRQRVTAGRKKCGRALRTPKTPPNPHHLEWSSDLPILGKRSSSSTNPSRPLTAWRRPGSRSLTTGTTPAHRRQPRRLTCRGGALRHAWTLPAGRWRGASAGVDRRGQPDQASGPRDRPDQCRWQLSFWRPSSLARRHPTTCTDYVHRLRARPTGGAKREPGVP
jgi:hypothetical protein